ncbi:MAG: hypothetical protein ICV81_17180, partial [Flavisolibacter sp.]|nr:hypothetical protein [Flavisolibacter sp.]
MDSRRWYNSPVQSQLWQPPWRGKNNDLLPGHEMFIWDINQSPAHIIATVQEKDGVVYQQPFYQHYFMTVLRLNHRYRFKVVKQQIGQF